jgi:4-hydroxythreonine-4-phosphate dehydrogenase
MPRVWVVADDLTGAADATSAMAGPGVGGLILLDPMTDDGPLPVGPDSAVDVVALDTDTRDAAAHLAHDTAYRAAMSARTAGASVLFRKVDSTLRGHVAAEVTATLAAARTIWAPRPVLAVVAPAFPHARRTTVGGHQLLDGVPLERTEVWSTAGLTGAADLMAMFTAVGHRSRPVPIRVVRGAPEDLVGAIKDIATTGIEIAVCDAETDQDLHAIVSAAVASGILIVWVGSAGLAGQLSGVLGLGGGSPFDDAALRPTGPVVTVVGSRSSVAARQHRRIVEVPGVAELLLDPDMLLAGEAHAGWGPASAALGAAVAAGRDLAVTLQSADPVSDGSGRHLCEAIGRLIAPYAGDIGALVCTGGETTRAVLLATGAHTLRYIREVEPGVVLSRADGTHALPVVTKAGGFGDDDTLVHARDELTEGARRQ